LVQYGHLPARILYSWADIYSQQLQSGDDYDPLRPTYSIWLLDDTLVTTDADYVHHYKLRDERGLVLVDHGGIWLFEIEKFNAQQVASEEQRWLRFLKEGESLNDQTLPEWMSTKEMEQAMTTLRKFSEKERDYHEYQARQNFIREQRTIQKERDTLEAELGGALEREKAALAEITRLKALMEQQGKPH
jgi:predicted transposase/invertase (TIGR01784 family)